MFFTAYHQARHLVARGHEVTLVSISPAARWGFAEHISAGVRIIESPDVLWGKARTGWDIWDIFRRICYLGRSDYDLVHGYESRPVVALTALYLRLSRGTPTILTWADWFGRDGKSRERGRWLSKIMGPLETFCEEYFYPKADRCVVMGEPLVERAMSIGIPRDRILNLLHGCDPEGISTVTIQEARTRLAKLPQKGVVLGYLGVLRPTSAELLVNAFQLIRKQVSDRCKLVLIGNQKLKFDKYIPVGLENDIVETGWLSYEQVNLYLAACDILLLPLKKAIVTDNVWPSKLNDYLAAGRPTVATKMRVLTPIFEKYQVGLLTQDEPQDFSDACLQILEDTVLWHRMAENARALSEGDLSWSHLVDRLEIFYKDLILATYREDR